MRTRLILAVFGFAVCAGTPPAAAQDVDPDMNMQDYPLEQVRLGRQVWGERSSKLDFENRVTLIYTWGITCPAATHGLAKIETLYEKYEDRGLVVVGFHCRREPWLIENNIVYECYRRKPSFPIMRRGWVSPWATRYIPWAAVYNHKGEMVFAGGMRELEKALVKALDDAPDYLVGGPYKHIGELASKIASDRRHVGRHMAAVRGLASGDENSPTTGEAREMLACLQRHVLNRLRKADEDPANVVERVGLYGEVAAWFEGDEIAATAKTRIAEMKAECDFMAEQEAYEIYRDAWSAFHALPPAGTYAYSMAYTPTDDASVLARRRRLVTEFRAEMRGVDECYPDTYATVKAIEALTHYVPAPLSKTDAKAKLDAITKLAGQAKDVPLRLHEVLFALEELLDAYPLTDDISKSAVELYVRTRAGDLSLLLAGRREYEVARRALCEVEEQIVSADTDLSAEDISVCIARLKLIAREAGEGSYLAGQAKPHVAVLEKALEEKAAPKK